VSHEEWGPLARLIGTWESGYEGRDVSYHNERGKLSETRYSERATFTPFGPVGSGDQCLYGLDYRTAIYREGEEAPFHTEVGYWVWDDGQRQVVRCFVMPHAQAVMAGARVEPDAATFRLSATIGSDTYGILSNLHLDVVAHTTRFDVTITVDADTYRYDQTTVVEHKMWPSVVLHTDRNTLHRARAND